MATAACSRPGEWRALALAAAVVLLAPAFSAGATARAQEPLPADTLAPDTLAADTAAADTVRGPEVEAVRFLGADALPRDALTEAIATAATGCASPLLVPFCRIGDFAWAENKHFLDRDEVARDEDRLETLYEIRGYPQAAVSARIEPRAGGDVAVVFEIEEGPPLIVEQLEVQGLDRISPPLELGRPLPLSEGEPYALPALDSTRALIRRELAERGYPFAEVQVAGEVDEEANAARVVLEVRPGPAAVFGPVAIRAEEPIDESVVRERVAYEPGQPFRPALIRETRRALYSLAAVQRATIRRIELGDTAVATRIVVTARELRGLELEGTISSTDCLAVAAFYRDRYFLDGPRVFSIGGGFSNLLAQQSEDGFLCGSTGGGEFAKPNYFVRAELRQPWPGHPDTHILLRAFFNRESAPRVYVQRAYGARVAVSHDFGDEFSALLAYAPRRSELEAASIYFCGNFGDGFCSAEGIERLTSFTWLAPVELLAIWTPTGNAVRLEPPAPGGPDWHYSARGGIEAAGTPTGSEYDYTRTVLEGSVRRLLGTRITLAARTRVGLIAGGEVLPPQIRLYSGGVNTVRGLAQNLLGPKALVASRENAEAVGCELRPFGCGEEVVGGELVVARPTGGEALVEFNVEARYWLTDALQLAAFLDYGVLWRDAFGAGVEPTAEFFSDGPHTLLTPGVGLRIITDIGPIRIDVGYDPSGPQHVPLFTRAEDSERLLFLGDVVFAPHIYDDPGFFTEFWRRLQLHIAVGQPF